MVASCNWLPLPDASHPRTLIWLPAKLHRRDVCSDVLLSGDATWHRMLWVACIVVAGLGLGPRQPSPPRVPSCGKPPASLACRGLLHATPKIDMA